MRAPFRAPGADIPWLKTPDPGPGSAQVISNIGRLPPILPRPPVPLEPCPFSLYKVIQIQVRRIAEYYLYALALLHLRTWRLANTTSASYPVQTPPPMTSCYRDDGSLGVRGV